MTIQPQEAADALRDIEQARRNSAKAYRYQRFSPHLFLWGAIWIIGYTISYFRPSASLIWMALVVIGLAASFWMGAQGAGAHAGASQGWKYGATALAIFLFITALFAILPPKSPEQLGAFFPILVALLYALVGIWMGGIRIILLAVALGALTVGGYFWLPQYFALWMAGVGGGALILGGFWLRRI